ncbi:MAG: hypothetical protein GX758_01950 [Tenericutes bacterium]|nr:hypothetical protein [Mycoplasmatota bacterium]
MKELSKECKESVININILINKAIKEIKVANARAEAAEKMLEVLKKEANDEIKKAYLIGYRKGVESISDGGTTKTNNDSRLVLKQD